MSDLELVTSAQAGNQTALDALIEVVRPAVFSYCRHRLVSYAGGLESAEDVTQETCLAVVRILPKFQQQGAPFAALVYAIAANKVADAQRRFSRSAVLVDELPDQTDPAPNPEEQVLAEVDVRAARELLARLPPRMRQVLILRASGHSADVIGKQLGMSANAVRVAQHRAGAKLRRLMEDSQEHREIFNHRMQAG